MARQRTGTVEPFTMANGRIYYRGRIRLGDGSREWVDVPKRVMFDREAAKAVILDAQEKEDRLGTLLKEKRIRTNKVPRSARDIETVREYVLERWIPERTARGLTSAWQGDSVFNVHIFPKLADLPIAAVTKDDIENVRDELDRKIRAGLIQWRTAKYAWSHVTKLFADVTNSKDRSLRVRKDNPAQGVLPPDRGDARQKTFLYPDEFLQLLACEHVPLRWRRLCALAVYTFARAAELAALSFRADIDFEHGKIDIREQIARRSGERRQTKAKDHRENPIEPALVPLLLALKAEADERKSDRVSPCRPVEWTASRQIKRFLWMAGCRRARLHVRTKTTVPVTFHDLRATGITWCAIRGDAPLTIMSRAGHRSFSTTQQYIRIADALKATAFGEVFPPLPAALLVRPNDWAKYDKETGRMTTEQANSFPGATSRAFRRHAKADVRNTKKVRETAMSHDAGSASSEHSSASFGPSLAQSASCVAAGKMGRGAPKSVAADPPRASGRDARATSAPTTGPASSGSGRDVARRGRGAP